MAGRTNGAHPGIGDRTAPKEACRIAMAGFLHDLGKVGMPDAVLRKPGRLTDDEFAQIKTHPRVGPRLSGRETPGLAIMLRARRARLGFNDCF